MHSTEHLHEKEWSLIDDFSVYFKLEKQMQSRHKKGNKGGWGEEITGIKEIEKRKIGKSNEIKRWFVEQINTISSLTDQEKRHKLQRNERETITISSTDTKRIIRE